MSNLDLRTMERLMQIDSAEECASGNAYNLGSPGSSSDLLPWMRRATLAMMAYSPLGLAAYWSIR